MDIEFDVTSTLDDYLQIADSLEQRKAVKKSASKTYYPNARILLFGQGPIMPSLTALATEAGFDIMCFDQHESYSHPISDYCDQYTALVSLFHEHEYEIDILKSALECEFFYIGALGSQKTHAARLQKLSEIGISQNSLQRIYGPVGLDIRAVTPSQIAISILAQIIAVMNQ